MDPPGLISKHDEHPLAVSRVAARALASVRVTLELAFLCALSLGAQAAESAADARPYSGTISVVLEDAERAFTILGIVVAGIWAYYNYFRGRTYRPRLEPEITATLLKGQQC